MKVGMAGICMEMGELCRTGWGIAKDMGELIDHFIAEPKSDEESEKEKEELKKDVEETLK